MSESFVRLCCVVAVFSSLLVAANFVSAKTISVETYLQTVRENHPFFKREQLQASIEKSKRDRYFGGQDWLLESSPVLGHRQPPQRTVFDPDRVDYLQLNARATRSFWDSGSRLSLWWTSGWTNQDQPGLELPGPGGPVSFETSPSTYYEHSLNATLSLPLMKNRGGSLDRLDVDLAAFDIDIASVNSAENQESFLLDVALKFIAWASREEQLLIARDRLLLAEAESKRTKRKLESRLVNDADLLRTEDAVLATRSSILLIESSWKSTQAELATIAGDESIYERRPQFDLYSLPEILTVDDAVASGKRRSRLLRVVDARLAQTELVQESMLELTRPELALNFTGSMLGGDDGFGGSLEVINPDVAVSLEFRYPLGNRTADADVATTRLQSRQLGLTRDDIALQLESKIRAVHAQMEHLRTALQEDERRIQKAKDKTEAEKRLYDQGRGDLTFVIQSRDGEAIARLDRADKASLYQQLYLQYQALTDTLLSDESRGNSQQTERN